MAKKTKGARSGAKAVRKESPKWVQMPKEEIEAMVVKLNSEGLSGSMIGMRLRDQYGIPSVGLATGKSVLQILKENKVKFEVPEDLGSLLKRTVELQKHMRDNPKDLHNKRGLQLIEARIKRLIKYYQRNGIIPETWKYTEKTAELQMK